ncbi:FeoB-associated Cys-rich membrane protein [Tenacibaculum maritimum]
MQEVLVYIVLFIAILFLVKKFVYKRKADKGCGTDCGCS